MVGVIRFNGTPDNVSVLTVTREKTDPEYRSFVKKIGIALALPMISVQPIIWFWDIYTMPKGAVSPILMELTIPALVLAAIVCHLLFSSLREESWWKGPTAFVLFFTVFGIMVATEQRAAATATKEYLDLAAYNAEQKHEEMEADAMATWKAVPADLGKKIFESRCTSCHSEDEGKVVIGPSVYRLLGKKVRLSSGKEEVRDRAYIERSISDPDADIVDGFTTGVMSGNISPGSISGTKLKALVDYLTRDSGGESGEGGD